MREEGVYLATTSDEINEDLDFLLYNIRCFYTESVQNMTIEERVSLLEMQVVKIEEDVTGLEVDLTELDENVDFLFDEQIIQDERLLELEQTSDEVVVELAEINVNIQGKKQACVMFNIFYLPQAIYIDLWVEKFWDFHSSISFASLFALHVCAFDMPTNVCLLNKWKSRFMGKFKASIICDNN